MENKIELVLDSDPADAKDIIDPKPAPGEVTPAPALEMASLTPEEQKMVSEFAKKIDINDSTLILQYGASAQKKVGDFSESALKSVKTKDLGEVGGMLSKLVLELKDFNEEEDKKGFLGFFKKPAKSLAEIQSRYDSVQVNVDKITGELENHQIQLMKDIAVLDKMYESNLAYFKEITMYILAGKQRLEEVRKTDLAEATEKAHTTGLPEDAQAARDLASQCDRFEKKIYDLELTRQISIQMAPQIRLIQSNDSLMMEKIQSSIVNTIPLWKSQIVLALGLINSQNAINAQREVTDMTNQLLRKNADALKIGTIEAAKESERAVVDIETLQYTNQALITTLDEVLQIQDEGRVKRREAEKELGKIENELKQKLLQIKG